MSAGMRDIINGCLVVEPSRRPNPNPNPKPNPNPNPKPNPKPKPKPKPNPNPKPKPNPNRSPFECLHMLETQPALKNPPHLSDGRQIGVR